jgi:hypothetical protein
MSQVTTLDDINYEAEGTAKAAGRLAAFDSSRTDARTASKLHERYLGSFTYPLTLSRREAKGYSGRALISQCGQATRIRYRTLLCVEASFPPDSDFGFLIIPACQILETEINRVLLQPAKGFGRALVSSLSASGEYSKQTEILKKWLRGEIPTTIGLASLVLLALRKWWEQAPDLVLNELSSTIGINLGVATQSKRLGPPQNLPDGVSIRAGRRVTSAPRSQRSARG